MAGSQEQPPARCQESEWVGEERKEREVYECYLACCVLRAAYCVLRAAYYVLRTACILCVCVLRVACCVLRVESE